MEIVLAAVDPMLLEAWKRSCGDLPSVRVHDGSILDLRVDAVVSPANSFGFMDGGIDLLYTSRFGPGVQRRLQERIRERHHGELLVGAAEIVETGDARIPWLIAAPTMRVPTVLASTVSPYLAARGALLLVRHGTLPPGEVPGRPVAEVVRSLAFPGLGTGVGRVPAEICARQVAQAIRDVVTGPPPFPASWLEANERHQRLYADSVRDLQREDPDRVREDLARLTRRIRRVRDRFRERWGP